LPHPDLDLSLEAGELAPQSICQHSVWGRRAVYLAALYRATYIRQKSCRFPRL